jgi:two-component system NtrC family sensor kinase
MFEQKRIFMDRSEQPSSYSNASQFPRLPVDSGPVPDKRRRISIRFRIAAGFLICFFMALSITLLSLYVFIRLQNKLHFLEVADNIMLELQQARRFEKNFFLYGTNLDDALDHVKTALKFLQINAVQLEEVVGKKNLADIVYQIQNYGTLLQKLLHSTSSGVKAGPEERTSLEADLRKYGAEMLSLGLNIVQQERQSVYRLLALAKQVPIYFLFCLFVVMAFLAHKLSRQILGPLSRLMKFTQRIAQGEFTPLKPLRLYRDEFYDLMQAMNFMLAEIHHRQEVLMQSHKLRAIGTLTAGIAHELNNPINNITLTAYTLRDDYQTLSDQDKKEMIQELISQADRTRAIIGNLLDFSRESEARMEPLNMGKLIEETVQLAGKQIKMAGAHLHLDLGAAARLYGDRQQLSQVILNILINALDVIPKDGHIQITLSQETPNFVAVKIRDDGPGILGDILPHIFDPFFTTKPPGKGTGLGLAVSQGIIARHGGSIAVESEPGQGTTFTVILPVTTI